MKDEFDYIGLQYDSLEEMEYVESGDEEYYEEESGDEEYYEEEFEDEEYYEEESEDEEYYEEEFEDEEYYEEEFEGEEYYEEEYGYEEIEESVPQRTRMRKPALADRIILGTGAAALLLIVIAGGMYIGTQIKKKQLAVLASVGMQLEGLEVVGDSGLMAVADAALSKIEAEKLLVQQQEEEAEKNKEYEEAEYSKSVTVLLKMVSVKRDLKIKFVNKDTDKLISNTPFSVTVTNSQGKTEDWSDDDMDGIIYKKGIAPGEYKIAVNAFAGTGYADYRLPADIQKAEVKKDIAYKKIDVADEVKTEAQINVATEEQKKQEPVVESALTDTVKWVESTAVSEMYIEVPKSNIIDPMSMNGGETPAVSSGDAAVTALADKEGNLLYVSENEVYRPAVHADYYNEEIKCFKKGDTKYTGWQTIDGRVYFFDESGEKMIGEQVIQGAKYNFADDGSLVTGSGVMGIDVSKHNGSIDWNAVKNSGVSYVIIRCGYRGYTQGALIEDPRFVQNINGATAAGLNVGVYFFSQAVDEIEAVAEASFLLDRVKGYSISYPIFLDVEYSGSAGNKGRADGLDVASRTAVCKAFCATIQSYGYTAGIYANKTWLETKIDPGQLSGYKIWLAQYSAEPTYRGRYDMWQYKSTGQVSGIKGEVDLNLSYLGY